ncbi:hypothetical protein JS533_007405 [Bifidobacterium amazonense]|uniref:Uncharacterized protein n=1 Tax=Bifidobacterium amazonense TaxID=2809027 RepID=A0ABS9VVJ8_9BIFI|nr:hypothetical protein [Bifidobacterium amazonense]MCH9276099.1 hypothetical protein [Bifidobacterium amazonense]
MTKVTLFNEGFREVRRSAGVMAELNKQAQAMASRANSIKTKAKAEYEADESIPTEHGSVARVKAANSTAAVDNALFGTLNKAIT